MYGKKRPDLTKWNTEHNIRIKVGQYDKNWNLIEVHDDATSAAKKLNLNTWRNINHLAKNWAKYPNRTVGGFKWKYHFYDAPMAGSFQHIKC